MKDSGSELQASDQPDKAAQRWLGDVQEQPINNRQLMEKSVQSQVQIERSGKDIVFSVHVAGQNKEVWRCADSGVDQAFIDKTIARLILHKEQELKARYKISFAEAGEDAIGKLSFTPDGKPIYGEMVHARGPHLAELYELESVMARANPSHLIKNNKEGLKFYFLSDSIYQNDRGAAATYTAKDKNNHPAVYLADSLAARLSAVPGSPDKSALIWQGGADSHMLLHELAHNSQNRLNLDQEKKLLQNAHGCGFYPFNPADSDATIWAIKTKDGSLFRRDSDVDGWVRIDSKNQTLNKAGQPSTAAEAQTIDDITMRNQALVRPPTFYFDNAAEMGAEGMALFRGGVNERRQLAKESADFYTFIKEQDQREIDLTWGKKHGQPTMLRLPDGTIRRNDGAARKSIRDFEATLAAPPESLP
jgi:hypothetical protein